MSGGIRYFVLPIAEVLHHKFKDAYFENFKETLIVLFILCLMKIMFNEAVLDEYFDERAYLQVEPGNTDFIHGLCKAERKQMKWFWNLLKKQSLKLANSLIVIKEVRF